MLEGLDAIDWAQLNHAYGAAADVPAMLRALDAPDADEREAALYKAYGNIFHQGTRYPATPRAVPFLIELASQPKPKQLEDLLALVAHCVAGYFDVVHGPFTASGAIWGTPARPMERYGETLEILAQCEQAAEPAVPLCLRLLAHPSAAVRQEASRLLAALWKCSERHEVLARVLDRFAQERDDGARAGLAFALTHLLPVDQGARLEQVFAEDPSDLARVVAAMGCVRRGHASDAIVRALVDWMDDDALGERYSALRFHGDELADDIGALMGSLGPEALASALPALVANLRTADGFGCVGVLRAALVATFGGRAAPKDARELTHEQRELLEALAHNQNFWTIGNALNVLMDAGLPSMRDAMAAYLGVEVTTDEREAARNHARAYAAFGPERALGAWLGVLERFPDDEEALSSAAALLVQTGRTDKARMLVDALLAAHPDDGVGRFLLGSIHAASDELEAALDAFTQAEACLADDDDNRAMARQNRIAVLQRLGRTNEALALEAERGEALDAEALYHRGLAQVKAGQYAECIDAISRALEQRPEHANSHYTIACAYALSGDGEKAIDAIARALELDPGLAPDIAADEDFASLRDDPRFVALVRANAGSA